jgi:hypothetical protein
MRTAYGCAAALTGGPERRGSEDEFASFRVGLQVRRIAALLGFEDEVATMVEVYPAWSGCTVEVLKRDCLFEDVGVEVVFRPSWIRAPDIEKVAELGEEELVVSAFSRGGLLPALAEA